jgi:hypothetical protein
VVECEPADVWLPLCVILSPKILSKCWPTHSEAWFVERDGHGRGEQQRERGSCERREALSNGRGGHLFAAVAVVDAEEGERALGLLFLFSFTVRCY